MTEKEFKNRYNKIIDWCIVETDKITDKLKKENKNFGLDTNVDKYKTIHDKYNKRIKELKEKYKIALTK